MFGVQDENQLPLRVKTPYLLPPLESIASVSVRAPAFDPVHLDLGQPEAMRFLRDIVTRMSGRLPLKKANR